jgi:hypothetical protein
MKTMIAIAALAASVAWQPAAASGSGCGVTPGTVDYVISRLDYDVSNIIRFNAGGNCSGRGGTLFAAATGNAPYTLDSVYYPDGHDVLWLMGTAQDLPGDPEGQKHLVIFGNTGWAASVQGIAFGTLFPSALEAGLIAALEDAATGSGLQSSYDLIDDFWTTLIPGAGLTFAPGDAFKIVAFSDGQQIGEGFTTYSAAQVPEPASWALLIAGFGLVGAMARRRRITIVAA